MYRLTLCDVGVDFKPTATNFEKKTRLACSALPLEVPLHHIAKYAARGLFIVSSKSPRLPYVFGVLFSLQPLVSGVFLGASHPDNPTLTSPPLHIHSSCIIK